MYRNLWKIILLLGVLPFPAGCLWMGSGKKRQDGNVVRTYLYGLFTMLTVFEVIAVPMGYRKGSLSVLVRIWLAVMLSLDAAGMIRSGLFRAQRSWMRQLRKKITPLMIVILICILFQGGYAARMQHVDEDDAYYLGTAVTTVQTGRLYKRNSYTGKPMKNDPLPRYALSSWPIFLAALSYLSTIQATILAHMLLPAIVVLWVYLVYALLGSWFFPGDYGRQGWFLLFTVLLFSFSGYSVYSAQVFPFIRGWQGKAVLSGAALPAVLYACLRAYGSLENCDIHCAGGSETISGTASAAVSQQQAKTGDAYVSLSWNERWTQLLLTIGFCVSLTTIGVALSLLVAAAFALYWTLRTRRARVLLLFTLSAIPALTTGVIYLILK